ncbi:hypothetical protein ABZ806_27665 [Spirillospora sp. NPDC047418]|jgi:hypothetical protein
MLDRLTGSWTAPSAPRSPPAGFRRALIKNPTALPGDQRTTIASIAATNKRLYRDT